MFVIRVNDEVGSYFCGFNEKCSQIILSRDKKNAKIYKDIAEINKDVVLIQKSTKEELSTSIEYS